MTRTMSTGERQLHAGHLSPCRTDSVSPSMSTIAHGVVRQRSVARPRLPDLAVRRRPCPACPGSSGVSARAGLADHAFRAGDRRALGRERRAAPASPPAPTNAEHDRQDDQAEADLQPGDGRVDQDHRAEDQADGAADGQQAVAGHLDFEAEQQQPEQQSAAARRSSPAAAAARKTPAAATRRRRRRAAWRPGDHSSIVSPSMPRVSSR